MHRNLPQWPIAYPNAETRPHPLGSGARMAVLPCGPLYSRGVPPYWVMIWR